MRASQRDDGEGRRAGRWLGLEWDLPLFPRFFPLRHPIRAKSTTYEVEVPQYEDLQISRKCSGSIPGPTLEEEFKMTRLTILFQSLALIGLFAMSQPVEAQPHETTAYMAGQEKVQICLPTTGSYTPKECAANFDPVGLCDDNEVAELDFCETYSPAPFCSLNGQNGQSCACYYFCKKKGPITPRRIRSLSELGGL